MGQTRVLPIRIAQSRAFNGDTLSFGVHATSGESSLVLPVQVHVSQLDSWSMADTTTIKATYFSSDTAPIGFITLPPKNLNVSHQIPGPPILALRVLSILLSRRSISYTFGTNRRRRGRYIQATFLGRCHTSPGTNLGHPTRGQESVGKLAYICERNLHLTIGVFRVWIGTDPAQMMLGALSPHSTSS